MTEPRLDRELSAPPDPGSAGTLEELLDRLRLLKVWAGNPSYDAIKDRVNAAWTAQGRPSGELTGKSTVADCFRRGRQGLVARVLFVDLRGFHPDPAQPPADPAAVLDGFLRLLGVRGQRVPHDLEARTSAYRAQLAGSRTLVVLDNAANADQVRP